MFGVATKRCDDLEQQLTQLEQELELSDRKVENFRNQVALRDAEIERLRALSEVGRPLEALVQDRTDRQSDRLIQQLQMQVDLLQSRNEELEARMVELMNHEASKIVTSTVAELERPTKAVQTLSWTTNEQVNASCQTETLDVPRQQTEETTMEPVYIEQIRAALREIEDGRGYLMKRIDVLTARERELIKELSTKVSVSKPTRRGDKASPIKTVLDQAVEKRLQGLEADRQRWRFEARKALNALHQLIRYSKLEFLPENFENHCSVGLHYHGSCDAPCISVKDHRGLVSQKRSITPPARHIAHLDRRNRSVSVDLPSFQSETLCTQLRNVQEERDHYRHLWEEAKYSLQRQRPCKIRPIGCPRPQKCQVFFH
ncbi:unnamed protein product [Echinostoma caproni]|uniref:Uncharacterized protein n=1 Tax=Echinostoma caproni TaxID=27848 RepID=A0A3P8GVK9_9TREM|nr:unnamed protein product [Echinostoma caproni]